MEERFAALENRVAQLEAQVLVNKAKATFDATEDLFDLKLKNPPRWEGASMDGLTASQATREQLLAFAKFQDWRAKKSDENNETDDKGRPKSFYPRRDAETARKWAARK